MLVRVPLLGGGFGSDPDAWRNAVAALHSLEAGRYVPSRVPGFPLFEGLLVALVRFGPIATNGAAIAAGLACIVLFARLLAEYRVASPGWVLAAFAFGPPLAVESVQTMDLAFGLAFFLGGWLAAKRGHPLLAGVLVALATGCRPTYALAHLAFLARLAAFRAPPERWLRYVAGAVPLTIALFVPVAIAPEARHLEQHLARHVARAHVSASNALPLARHAARFLFGSVGTPLVALGAVVIAIRWLRRRAARAAAPLEQAAERAFGWALAAGIGGFWLLIPYSAAYLLPLVPVVLIALARSLPRPLGVATMVAIGLQTFAGLQYRPPALVPGALATEMAARESQSAGIRELLASAPEAPTVYVVGREAVLRLLVTEPRLERRPAAWEPFEGPGVALVDRSRRVAYAASLTAGERDSLEGAGWRVEGIAP